VADFKECTEYAGRAQIRKEKKKISIEQEIILKGKQEISRQASSKNKCPELGQFSEVF
jgi:hypothetical protein